MSNCLSLPGLKKVGYVLISNLPDDVVLMALTGMPVKLIETMITYFNVTPGAVCEVEEEYVNGVQVEEAKLKFSTLLPIPTRQPLAFVIMTMNDERYLIGAKEHPRASVKVNGTTGQTDGDASLKNYTVTFKARKALAKFDEFYDAL